LGPDRWIGRESLTKMQPDGILKGQRNNVAFRWRAREAVTTQ
jgi:hypothetical protein